MKARLLTGLLFAALVGFFSCQKENNLTEFPYQAEVAGLNQDCGLYQIRITKGLDKVISMVGPSTGDNIYIAKNLPDGLKIKGLKILLDLRKPQNNESGVCTCLGPAYPWVFVTKAQID